MIPKSSDFWICLLNLNSHSIRAYTCLGCKFNNQKNAQNITAVHNKH